ncbi:MAG: ATP-binding protein [Lachnospiraceae bacterium]|nr:ATP-binding protein [Lachnospiraceae bacterium]
MENEKEYKVLADVDQLDQVMTYMEAYMNEVRCDESIRVMVMICVEEIFVNIAHYAYRERGYVWVRLHSSEENNQESRLTIRFEDEGKPFDPLQRADPDVTLGGEERKIGGLGIFMVKQSMDEVSYEYANGRNIFTMEKKWKRNQS